MCLVPSYSFNFRRSHQRYKSLSQRNWAKNSLSPLRLTCPSPSMTVTPPLPYCLFCPQELIPCLPCSSLQMTKDLEGQSLTHCL